MFRSRVDCTSPLPSRTATFPQTVPSRDVDESHVEAGGKFLFVGDRKFYVRGVTYGPFRRSGAGEYHTRASVARDFSRIAQSGFNAVRLYTVPPRWLLDEAREHRL